MFSFKWFRFLKWLCFSSDIFLKKSIFTSSFSFELETVQKYPLSFYCYKKGRMLLWIIESIWYKCKRNFYMIWIKSAQPNNSFCKWLTEYIKAGAGESNIKPAFGDSEEICLYKTKSNWHPAINKLVLCPFHMKQSSPPMWWYYFFDPMDFSHANIESESSIHNIMWQEGFCS